MIRNPFPPTKPEAAFDLPMPSSAASSSPDRPQGTTVVYPGTVLEKLTVSKVIRPTNVETPVLLVDRPCSAVDVFVDMRNVPASGNGVFAFRIYAILGSVRTQVGTGRCSILPSARELDQVKHVASARVAAQSFEITIAQDKIAGGDVAATGNVEFPISAIGYQAQGAHPLARGLRRGAAWVPAATGNLCDVSRGELLRADGVNGEAAIRFIQVWDAVTSDPTLDPGRVLIDEVQVPAGVNWRFDYGDFPLEFQRGLVLANSTTEGAFVAAPAAAAAFFFEVR